MGSTSLTSSLGPAIMYRQLVCMFFCASLAHAQGYPPEVSASKMKVADGLEVKLVASEPLVKQPVAVEFDDRGRLWVVQYLQYPNPAGLKRVEVDRFSRTKYDQIPEPPPHGPKGSDRISILEDSDGDGRMDRARDFVTGLNFVSSIAFGRGGVYVLQAPYLLFYPDANRDDIPDRDPDVLLTGFGMDDAHSVANSLTWGPDGWLYGLQGSTVTAKINGQEFQQGIWRYHPESRWFELFAEGGGNMWGLDFDRDGECFASTNVGGSVMLHFVKGAYYWKQFGKHGALHNPYAFGYFDHVKHLDVKGGHVSVGGLFYEGGAFPAAWQGRYLAADLLEHGIHWHDVSNRGSSYQARQGGDLLAANDNWFAPSDMTLGPDGCLYVTDWHDKRTAHPDPDAEWDRSNGRIYRIQPKGFRRSIPLDFDAMQTGELVANLSDRNVWKVRRARRILTDRKAVSIASRMISHVNSCGGPIPCVEALWALNGVGGLDQTTAESLLAHPDPAVRSALIRLIGDQPELLHGLSNQLVERARTESSLRVRSHLAALAAELSHDDGLRLLALLASRPEDALDPMLPLRVWWSLERQITRLLDDGPPTEADQQVLAKCLEFGRDHQRKDRSILSESNPFVEEVEARIVRRFASDTNPLTLQPAIQKVARTKDAKQVRRFLDEIEIATAGRRDLNGGEALIRLKEAWPPWRDDPTAIVLFARIGDRSARDRAFDLAINRSTPVATRARMLSTAVQSDPARAQPLLLEWAKAYTDPSLREAAFHALAQIDSDKIADTLLAEYTQENRQNRKQIRELLSTRPSWALALLEEVDAVRIARTELDLDEVRRLTVHQAAPAGKRIQALIRKHWGQLTRATPESKLAEVRRLHNDLRAGTGELSRGRELFKEHCAGCHKLFGEGNAIGPDLTHANRNDRDFLLVSLVAPNDVIRQEYRSLTVHLKDGRVLSGVVGSQTPHQLVLIESSDKRVTINREEIEEMADSATSLMPEDLYRKFGPEALRDLFRYLQSDIKSQP